MRIILILFFLSRLIWLDAQTCVDRKYSFGLEVIVENIEEHVPSEWQLDDLKAQNFEDFNCGLLSAIVDKEYLKYPNKLRKALELKLVWFSKFKFEDVDYWGTYSSELKTVYLKSLGADQFYTRQMFHHELSSILLMEYGSITFEDEFRSLAPKDFQYFDEVGNGRNAIGVRDSEKFEDELNEQGFLNEYSMSFWENDFNEISQNLFLPKTNFWEIYNEYPKVKEKTDLVISFYQSIHPKFKKSFFQSLSK